MKIDNEEIEKLELVCMYLTFNVFGLSYDDCEKLRKLCEKYEEYEIAEQVSHSTHKTLNEIIENLEFVCNSMK